MLGPIFIGVSHSWKLPFMYWNQQMADYYAGHCTTRYSIVGNLFWTYCAPQGCHLHLLLMLQPLKDQMRFHHLQKIVYQFQILFHIKIKHQILQDLDFQMELQVVLNSIEWTQLILMRWKQLYRQNFEKRKHISNLNNQGKTKAIHTCFYSFG